jgi:hypothetical protein
MPWSQKASSVFQEGTDVHSSAFLVGIKVAERLFAEGKLLFPAFSPFSQKKAFCGQSCKPCSGLGF